MVKRAPVGTFQDGKGWAQDWGGWAGGCQEGLANGFRKRGGYLPPPPTNTDEHVRVRTYLSRGAALPGLWVRRDPQNLVVQGDRQVAGRCGYQKSCQKRQFRDQVLYLQHFVRWLTT